MLSCQAARELGLQIGAAPFAGVDSPRHDTQRIKGIEIVQEGWERSNYYIEARLWER